MANNTFANWTPSNIIDWTEKFDEVYNDDGRLVLESKETFKDSDNYYGEYEYKYAIRCNDLPTLGSDDSSISVELLYVVLPKYWSKTKQEDAMHMYCVSSMDDMWFDDCLEYAIPFGCECIDYDENEYEDGFYNVLENEDVVNCLNIAASVIDGIDSMRGFSLDKTWNRIGNTGWDILDDVMLDKNMIKSALERMEK
ncbi:MAG: hypothetical protein IKB96_05380 [Prevotella sp.]|nr:hypothetical protein [Prevotella sp.]